MEVFQIPVFLITLAFSLFIPFPSWYSPTGTTSPASMSVSKQQMDAISRANLDFAVDLYKILRREKTGNMFISPYSIVSALAMTLVGARENTKDQMMGGLRLPKNAAYIHDAVAQLNQALEKANDNVTLNVANKIYPHKNYELQKEFLSIVQKTYQGESETLDFSQGETARKVINEWVEEKTKNKIKDLIPSGVLNALTRLVLVNAIYFKGNWLEKFDAQRTKPAPFHLLDGSVVNVDMMFKKDKYCMSHVDGIEATVLEIPYKGKQISMFVILPNKKDGLPTVETKLTGEILNQIVSERRYPSEVMLYLPKFKIEDSATLNDPLKQMGMEDLFDEDKADLSGISGTKDLFVSHVLHKAFIEVNEEGSEAAAATAVMVMCRSMPMPPQQFTVDHPFLFVIVEKLSNQPIFCGSLSVIPK